MRLPLRQHPYTAVGMLLLLPVCFLLLSTSRGRRAVYTFLDPEQTMLQTRQDNLSFAVSPVGKKIVFSAATRAGSNLFLLNLDTLQVSGVTQDAAYKQRPSFAPDGNEIAFAASTTSEDVAHIFLCAAAGGPQRQITSSAGYDTSPAFSPDASHLVFARAARKRRGSMGGWTWDEWDVFCINTDGTNLHQITNGSYYQLSAPQWSPDGKQILFSITHGPQVARDVCVVDSNGASAPLLLTKDGHSSDAAYSPDGKEILYISDVAINYDYEVWKMHYDGTNPRQITHNGSYNQVPRYLPKANRILLLSDPARKQRFDLWQVDVNGQNSKRIADSALFDDPLHWKPK